MTIDENVKQSVGITEAESVMAKFMQRLEDGTLQSEQEVVIGKEITMDCSFIESCTADYGKMVRSTFVQNIFSYISGNEGTLDISKTMDDEKGTQLMKTK